LGVVEVKEGPMREPVDNTLGIAPRVFREFSVAATVL